MKRKPAGGPLKAETLPDYNTYVLTDKEKRDYFFYAGTSLFLLGLLFYKNIILSLLMVLLSIPWKQYYEIHLSEKRKETLTAQFRDFLYGLSASISAGRQLPEAVSESRDQLLVSYGPEAILFLETDYMVRSMAESQESMDQLLHSFADRSHVMEVRQFVHICSICKKTGGDMERVIGKTASVLMDKIAVKRELQMMTAQKRLEAKILTAIPIVMVLMLNLLSPDYLTVLYEKMAGRGIMTAALMGIAASYWISSKITEITL